MKLSKKLFTSLISLILSANTVILPVPAVQAALAAEGLIEGTYYGVSKSDFPTSHSPYSTWKLGPLKAQYSSGITPSVESAAKYAESKDEEDEALVFNYNAGSKGGEVYTTVPVDLEMEKGDIYTFAFDMYTDPGAGDATSSVQIGMSTTTASTSGNYAEYTAGSFSKKSRSPVRDFGPGGTWYANDYDCGSYVPWDTKFVRYEIIIDTEDEEYDGRQTIEINVRSDKYNAKKRHFKAEYYQVDDGGTVLRDTVDMINSMELKLTSSPKNGTTSSDILFVLDNFRYSVYHRGKAAKDAIYLKAEKGKYSSKVFSTVSGGGASATITKNDNEEIAFDVPAGEAAVAYRDITAEGATMNIAGKEASTYVYADILLPEGENASDYYIALASMPHKADNDTGNARGVSLSGYYTTPGQMQRVEIPISEIIGSDSVIFANGGAAYEEDAQLMFLAGVGIARKSGTGSIEVGDIYIVGDVEPPSSLKDVEVVSGRIKLNWVPSKNTITEYELYRNDTLIATLDGNATEYTDTGLENDRYYSYTLRGKCAYGKYTSYAELKDIYLPAVGIPTNVSFRNLCGSELAVECSWNAPTFGEVNGYIVYRNGVSIAELGADQFTYKDTDIEPNVTYTYELCAFTDGGMTSHKVSGEVLAAYVYAPENLSYDGTSFTWKGSEFAASYKLYINGNEYGTSTTNSYTLSEPLAKNDILTAVVKAYTAEGNASLESKHIRVFEKKDKLETVQNYYSDELPGNVKIYTTNAECETEETDNVGIGQNSIAVTFTPVSKGAVVFRGPALGSNVSAGNGVILLGMYIPKNTDLQKLRVGLSYVPAGTNTTAAYASVPIEKYVKATDRWTAVEIPLSDIPTTAEYKLNNQTKTLQFEMKKATDVCIVGDYASTDTVADILVDEITVCKYIAGNTDVAGEGTAITSDDTALTVTTESGFDEKALSGDNVSVTISNEGGEEIPAVTVLGASNTPKIVLASQFEANGKYTVKINGAADANGGEISKETSFTAVGGTSGEWIGESVDLFGVKTDTAYTSRSFKAYISAADFILSSDKLNKLSVTVQAMGNASVSSDIKLEDITLAEGLSNAKVTYSGGKAVITADIDGRLSSEKPIIIIPLNTSAASGAATLSVKGRLGDTVVGVDIAEVICGITVSSGILGGNGSGSSNGSVSKVYDSSGNNAQYGGQRPTTSVVSPTEVSKKLSFSDVTPEHWAYEYISSLIERKVIYGYDDGTFQPSAYVTRAEFVTMLRRAFRLNGDVTVSFSDVAEDAWYAEDIGIAASGGVVSGMGDGTFAPNDEITRQDMCVMLKNVMDTKGILFDKKYDLSSFTDSEDIAEYAKEAINSLKQAGIIDGYDDGAFRPRKAVTRAESAKVIALVSN